MSTFTTPAVSEAGKAVALAVVIAAGGGVHALGVAPLVILLLPLPLAYLTSRRGVRVGVAAMVCAACSPRSSPVRATALLTLFWPASSA